jgi:hypothetical protein
MQIAIGRVCGVCQSFRLFSEESRRQRKNGGRLITSCDQKAWEKNGGGVGELLRMVKAVNEIACGASVPELLKSLRFEFGSAVC